MKARLLVLAILLTVFALAPEPPAWANFTCPQWHCVDVTQDCIDSGGAPIPQGSGQTCIGPPWGDEYNMYFILCFYPSTGKYTQLACYQ